MLRRGKRCYSRNVPSGTTVADIEHRKLIEGLREQKALYLELVTFVDA
jgi:hypothetical protein